MRNLFYDFRLTLRMLRRSKGFAAATLLTLALGIGANTAVFSVVYGVLMRPLPYPDPERLVRLSEEHPGATAPLRGARLSNLTFHAWNDSPQTIEGMAAYSSRRYTITGFEEPQRVDGAAVSAQLFSVLGVRPLLGRFLRPEEEPQGADSVVVLSHAFWQQHYGGDPAVVGRSLVIDGQPRTVIGVTAPDFYFPDRDARLWTPYSVRRRLPPPNDGAVSVLFAIARLKIGTTEAQAEAEGTAAARSVGKRPLAADLLFGKGGPVTVHVRSLVTETTSSVAPALNVIAVGVGLILLIVCANVANLFLSRGVARSQELAVRAALGAGVGRLVQQLLVESLTLALAGGALGLLLAWGLTAFIPFVAPPDFPRLDDIRVDGRILAFAALASILSGILSGLVPAIRGARFNVSSALHGGWSTAGGFAGTRNSRTRAALLVSEAALAVILLVGASLLIRSFVRLVQVDAGYDPANVLIARIQLPGGGAESERARRAAQFAEALLARIRGVPSVVAAGAGNMAPFKSSSYIAGFSFPARDGGEPIMARALQHRVTPGYAEALGFRLDEGRFFTEQDVGAGVRSILVNREFVRQYLPSGPVAGRRYQGLLSESDEFTEIVGVVGDVLKDGLDARPQPEIYQVHSRDWMMPGEVHAVVRTSGDPTAMAPLLRSFVGEIERDAAMDEIGTLAAQISTSVSQPRFVTGVLVAFAALALLLAAVGLHGVLSYIVSQRRRELGIRAALGATPRDLIRLVMGQGLAIAALGLALGLAGAAVLTRMMTSLLFGIEPLDPASFLTAPAVLLLVTVFACLSPSRRAAAADPSETLRAD